MEVKLDHIRRTGKGYVVADLVVSDGVVGVKFCLRIRKDVVLRFDTTNGGRAELAAQLLRRMGVDVKTYRHKKVWYVFVSLRKLAGAGVEKSLKEAVAASIRAAAERGWVDAKRAQRWIVKMAGLPAYNASDKLAIYSRNPEVLKREAQRLRKMGLVEGRHFALKMPEDGAVGRLRILARGLVHAAWLSVHGEGERQRLAAEFLEQILRAAQEEGGEVYRRVKRAVERGVLWGSLTLRGFKGEVEGRVVEIKEGSARLIDGRLKIAVVAEVGGVGVKCEISFVKLKKGGATGFVKVDAAEDAERVAAVIKAITGIKPTIARLNNGACVLRCNEKHLKALTRYAELAGCVEKWTGG